MSAESRELVSALVESRAFRVDRNYLSNERITDDLGAGKLDAALIIPVDFAKKRSSGETAEVQFLVDAVDSNTATIASGYAAQVISQLNKRLVSERGPAPGVPTPPATQNNSSAGAPGSNPAPQVKLQVRPRNPSVSQRVALLYNPGLENSWFIVTGLIGALLVLQGTIVAAASMVREKEVGTVEQLLMTPAGAGEIITAKIAPVFLLLTADIGLTLGSCSACIRYAGSRQSLAVLFLRFAVRLVGDRHRNADLDVCRFSATGTIGQLLCKSAPCTALRSDNTSGSNAKMASAVDDAQSGQALFNNFSRNIVKGNRHRDPLS